MVLASGYLQASTGFCDTTSKTLIPLDARCLSAVVVTEKSIVYIHGLMKNDSHLPATNVSGDLISELRMPKRHITTLVSAFSQTVAIPLFCILRRSHVYSLGLVKLAAFKSMCFTTALCREHGLPLCALRRETTAVQRNLANYCFSS